MSSEKAYLGGGCFWCTEAIFNDLKGVLSVTPGYSGGTQKHPSYEDVSSGKTGHAEIIAIEFDPAIVTYENLLSVFFATHDPTTLNHQGSDVGDQYRSVILYVDEKQKMTAEKYISFLNHEQIFPDPVVTHIVPFEVFYPAEPYHQKYYEKNREQPYCQAIITPKIQKLHQKFKHLLKS